MTMVLNALEEVFMKHSLGDFEYYKKDSGTNDYTSFVFASRDDSPFIVYVGVEDNITEYNIYSGEDIITTVDNPLDIIPSMHKVLVDLYKDYLERNKERLELVDKFTNQAEYFKGK